MKKIDEESLYEIHKLYFQFKKSDIEIEAQNLLKEFYLKYIIEELKKVNFLKQINDIEKVTSSQFELWQDIENPNWQEIVLHIFTEKKPEEFDNYADWMTYENIIKEKIFNILDDNGDLNEFVIIEVEA